MARLPYQPDQLPVMRFLLALTIAAAPTCAAATVSTATLPYDGPLVARFFFAGPEIDGVPVYAEQMRCWSGKRWMPLRGATCIHLIFHDKPPPLAPAMRRLE